jgi:hypothetical protein
MKTQRYSDSRGTYKNTDFHYLYQRPVEIEYTTCALPERHQIEYGRRKFSFG